MRRAIPRLAIAALGTVVLAWAVASLWWPFQSDHGVYAWMGDVTLHGGMPYRDAWDVKGPVALLPAMLAEVLFGRNMWGIRLLDLLALGASAWALYTLAARWTSRPVAWLTTFIWLLAYASTGFNSTAQPDGFGAVLLLLAAVPLLGSRPPGKAALFGAALAVGLLTMLKPVYLGFVMIPAVAALPWEGERGPLTGRFGVIAAGTVLPVLAFLAWFQARGALRPLWRAYVEFNLAKNGPGLVPGFISMLVQGVLSDPVWLLLLACASAGAVLLWPSHRRATAILVCWIVMAMFVIHLQRPFYTYRAHVLTAPVALLVAVTCWQGWLGGAAGRSLALAIGTTLAIIFVRTPLAQAVQWARYVPGPGAVLDLQEHFLFLSTSAAGQQRLIGLVREVTAPGDSIFVYRHPAVYFLADRPSVSRFSVTAAFAAGAPQAYARAQLAELGRALQSSMPSMIVLPASDTVAGTSLGCFEPLSDLPSVATALTPHYRLIKLADGFAVFTRSASTTEGRKPPQ